MSDPRLLLHAKAVETINRIMPLETIGEFDGLDPGFLRFSDTERIPILPNTSTFSADALQLEGLTSMNLYRDGTTPIEAIRTSLIIIDFCLFTDGSPFARETDLEHYKDQIRDGDHCIICGPETPATILSFLACYDYEVNDTPLTRLRDQGLSEYVTPEIAASVLFGLGQLTTEHIDPELSI